MINPLPVFALSAVAMGYFGAVGSVDRDFNAREPAEIRAYSASANAGLSVQDDLTKTLQPYDQPFCAANAEVADQLNHDFAEVEQTSWTQGKDMTLELFASELMGTWTLVHAGEDGVSCIVSSGFGWTKGVTPQEILTMASVSS
jgi:hypothetical protein